MRVATMLTCGLVTAVVVGISGLWGYAALIGWDVSAVVFLGWVWLAIAHMDARTPLATPPAKIRTGPRATPSC